MSENTQDRSKLKFDLWERKLLDLSARNTLLNCKLKGKAVPLLVTSCCDVEDCIAQEKDYAIVSRTDAGENEDKTPKIPDIELEFAKISDTAAFTEVLSSAIGNGKIYSPLTDAELEGRMKDLYRSSRTAMEEDGAGTLFLACGFLKWIGDEKKETYYAPLILIPVDLVRKFGVGKYVMRKNDEDVRMNVTILEKLRQDFDIIIPELEGELPTDINGVDVKGVIETVKGSVSAKDGWEVVDACVLGMFSFSQFVMWNDMHSHREEIASNKIVKSLLEGKLAWDYEDMEKAGEDFRDEGSVYLPISADASQLYAIKRAGDGASFVLHGPPGTGKSQTITSLIANALANGKTVLFAAEKKAALDVVYSRLSKIGIAPFCLELHSNKVRKGYVLDQLKEATEIRLKGTPSSGYDAALADITARREELDSYMTALGEMQGCGYTLFEMLNVYAKNQDQADVTLDEGFETDLTKDKITACETALGELTASGKGLSGVLGCVKATEYSQDTKVQLAPELDALEQSADKLDASVKAFTAAYPKLGSGEDFATVRRISDTVAKYTQDRAAILKDWAPEFLALDGVAKKGELAAAQSKMALFRSGAVGKVYDSIKAYDKNGSHRNDLGAQLDLLCSYRTEYEGYGFEASSPKLSPVMTELLASKDEYVKAYDAVKARLGLEEDALADSGTTSAVKAMTAEIRANEGSIRSKTIFNACAARCVELKIAGVVKAFEDGSLGEDQLIPAFRKAWSKLLTCKIIDSNTVLKGFSGKVFDEKVAQLSKVAGDFEKITREEIYLKIASKLPDLSIDSAASSGLGTLQHAIKSRGRGVSIRSLLTGIENLILKITPCVLMSPMSAAQFIAPSKDPMFDLVVFDEASQLPTCKAVGVLARGKNAVIVGDPKQMPPTAFFREQVFDDENFETEDLESILDDCLAVCMPQTHLLWHYRSRHESLISFSNRSFYESKLYTFPSADDLTSHVTYVKCEGSFDSGKSRTNEEEARLVTEELVRCSKDPEKSALTYGIVTFNIQQQGLIEDKIDEECRKDADFEKWAFGREEPIFIKNLENVQGDERDVILFSVGYGPDSEGKLSMNFGPLNRDGGWRRLNVAVTRSRCEMKVFSSIDPEQLRVNESTPDGVKAFKRFLMYASGKETWDADLQASAAGEGNSPLIDRSAQFTGMAEDICARLKEKGYETKRGVGKSGFKVDIGVVSKEDPGKYCLGILIDGSAPDNATATSREISQPSVLKGLGWNVVRVWSVEWWEDPDAVIAECIDAIENEKKEPEQPEPEAPAEPAETAEEEIPVTDYNDQIAQEQAEAAEDTEPQAEEPAAEETPADPADAEPAETEDVKKKTDSIADAPVPYQVWPCALSEMTSEEFRNALNTQMLSQAVLEIVEQEAPISFDMLVDRLCNAFGIKRKSPQIIERCEYLVKYSKIHKTAQNLALQPTPETKKIFLWRRAGDENGIQEHFRQPAEGEKPRDAQDITLQEAARAAIYVCKTQYGMPREELVKQTAYALGFKTSGGWASLLATAGIDYAVHEGELSETPLKIV